MTESSQTPSPSGPIKIGSLSIPRRAFFGSLVVLLYVAGAAFGVGYFNYASKNKPAPPASAINRCWNGAEVELGKRCSADHDDKALFWALGLDRAKVPCERSKDYDWAAFGFSCAYRDAELRMAIWKTPDWRDRRLAEYGEPRSVGRGLLLHEPGTAGDSGRSLLRYDSDVVLLYVSVKAKDSDALEKLIPQVKSRTELLYGSKAKAG